jgi:hypothetical protein
MFSKSQLVIFFQSTVHPDPCDFEMFINDVAVDVIMEPGTFKINFELAPGTHLLKLRSLCNKKIEISEVQLDQASLRQTLYLSYLETANGDQIQPCTSTWEPDQIWNLPFGNPVSFWIESTLDRIPQGQYGQDLHKKYKIWYPSAKIDLPDNFSTAVKDFFKYDFGFTVRAADRTDLRTWPIVPLNLDLSQTGLVVDEFESLKLIFDQQGLVSKNQKQNQYNMLENQDWTPDSWYYINFYRYNEDTQQYYHPIDPAQIPALWKQIQQWDIKDYVRVNIVCLEPGGYASPHKDASVVHETGNSDYEGCCQFYIPLDVPNNNYIKLAGAGIVDTSKANALNITDFTHSAVNNSDQTRYVLIIRCNIENNLHLIA